MSGPCERAGCCSCCCCVGWTETFGIGRYALVTLAVEPWYFETSPAGAEDAAEAVTAAEEVGGSLMVLTPTAA